MILFQNLAHDAVGTGRLGHAGTGGNLGLVSLRTAGWTLESHCTRTVQVPSTNRICFKLKYLVGVSVGTHPKLQLAFKQIYLECIPIFVDTFDH